MNLAAKQLLTTDSYQAVNRINPSPAGHRRYFGSIARMLR
jgi:hypothetical protein